MKTAASILFVLLLICIPVYAQETNTTATPDKLSFRETIAVQAFLDRKNLSCGCIDGVGGTRTREAVATWQSLKGIPSEGILNHALLESIGGTNNALTTYTVTSNDIAQLVTIPETWIEKAKLEKLGYETILEYVAEKYHASEAAIKRLNPDITTWPNPPAETILTVPNPNPTIKPMASKLLIQLSEKRILAYDANGGLIALFPCSIAKKVEKRPVGLLTVVNAADNPSYTYDPAMFAEERESRSIKGKLIISSGPNNPVGLSWISLDKPGYGIHGTPKPEDIGKTESHGCFRLTNWNAQKLSRMITIGTKVEVVE